MKFLDTNVLAYAFYPNEYTEICQDELLEGGLTNTFCLAEAYNTIFKETKSKEKAETAIKTLMKLNLSIMDVDVNVIHDAMKRAIKNNLSIFDAVHYVTALMNNCSAIISYDKDFDNLNIPREEP